MHTQVITPLKKIRMVVYSTIALGFAYALSFLVYPTLLPSATQATAGVPSTPTLSISPSSTVSFSVTPGTFNHASQTLSVSTTNYTGYKLTLSADSSADLVGTDGAIPTITLPSGSSSITSSSITNGYGYSLDATNYKPVLTGEGSTLDTTSVANTTANDYTLTFGANVDRSIPAGVYTKSFTLTATANDTGYVINYNANAGSDTVTGMPSPNPAQGTISGLNVQLSSAEPERDGYNFLGWDEDDEAETPTYEAGDTFTLDPETANQKTLYAIWEASSLVINYDANGYYFGNDSSNTVNTVNYNATFSPVAVTNPKYSHTPNLLDDGERNTSYNGAAVNGSTAGNYANSYTMNDVVTIPGASQLQIQLTYAGESASYDWVSVWSGSHPGFTAASDFNDSSKVDMGGVTTNKYGGGSGTTVSGTISGNTVTFAFKSDGSGAGNGYGYYAVITGYDSNNNVITTANEYSKTVASGTYATPTLPTGMNFVGWSESSSATSADYADESAVSTGLAKVNGDDPVTLYAVYSSNVTIKTATGISSVTLKEGTTTVCTTSSTSGTTCALPIGKAYTLTASVSSGYSFNTWAKTGVGTTLSNSSSSTTFTTGAGATTLTPSTNLNSYNITVNFDGSVSSVVFANTTYGNQTVSSSGGTASLKYNQRYNITVTLSNGNHFLSWTKNSGSGTLGSTSTMNTYFTPGAGTATLTLKSANTQIKTAKGISTVTVSKNGSTVCSASDTTGAYCNLTLGTAYDLVATPSQGFSLSSWSNTGNGTTGGNTATTTFTPAQSSAIDVITPAATGNPYTVTVVFGNAHVSSVTVGEDTITTSGDTVTLTAGNDYALSGVTDLSSVQFTSTANGSVSGGTYSVIGDATLTATGVDRIYMQNATSAQCGETMYDPRGGTDIAYTTAMIGSLCWMTKNLDLPGGTHLTDSDTNLNNGITSYDLTASSTSGFSSNTAQNVYNSNSTTCANNTPCYSYYTYAAATAGTNPSSGAATSDICPSGWRLPTQAEFNTLKSTYTTGATLTASPFLGVYGGYYNYSSFNLGGSYGYYWSSTAVNSSDAYTLYFYSSRANVSSGYKRTGYSIRCVAQE